MKKIHRSLCVVTFALGAMGRAAMAGDAQGAELMTCWYNENEVLTGSSPAPEGAVAGVRTQIEGSGNHMWSYTIEGRNAAACPAKLPIGTLIRE